MMGVTIGDQPSSWWPVASARDLTATGIEVIASFAVGGMVVDGAGAVWVDLPAGLARLDPVTWSATVWDAGDDAAFAGKGFVRASNGPGSGWWGRTGLACSTGSASCVTSRCPPRSSERSGRARSGSVIRRGSWIAEVGSELWIARDTGVARCDGHTWSMVGEGQLHDVVQLALTPWGEVWAGTWTGSGLRWMRYDGYLVDADRPAFGRGRDRVGSGRGDRGGLWARGRALRRLPVAGPVPPRSGCRGWTVWAVAAAGDGTVWAVTGDALLRSADRAVWDTIAAPDGTQLTGVAVSGAQVVVSADTGVYHVVGEDLERVWSPGEGQAVSDDILDVVAVSGDRAWVVAADWTVRTGGVLPARAADRSP